MAHVVFVVVTTDGFGGLIHLQSNVKTTISHSNYEHNYSNLYMLKLIALTYGVAVASYTLHVRDIRSERVSVI